MSFQNVSPLSTSRTTSLHGLNLSEYPWLDTDNFHHLSAENVLFVIDDYYEYTNEYKGVERDRIAYLITFEDGTHARFSLGSTDARLDQMKREEDTFSKLMSVGICTLRLVERELGNDFYVIDSVSNGEQELPFQD